MVFRPLCRVLCWARGFHTVCLFPVFMSHTSGRSTPGEHRSFRTFAAPGISHLLQRHTPGPFATVSAPRIVRSSVFVWTFFILRNFLFLFGHGRWLFSFSRILPVAGQFQHSRTLIVLPNLPPPEILVVNSACWYTIRVSEDLQNLKCSSSPASESPVDPPSCRTVPLIHRLGLWLGECGGCLFLRVFGRC